MGSTRAHSLFYNLIWILVILTVVALSLLGGSRLESLALEQNVRCGMTEHAHTEDCYAGSVLTCGHKAHTHSSDCYLVLLEDNDINRLLQTVSGTKDKSLESVIDSTLIRTLQTNEPTSPTEETVGETVSDLEESQTVVLNQALEDTVVLAAAEGTTARANVSVTPVTGSRAINLYLYIVDENGAGSWQCVDTSLQYTNTFEGFLIFGTYYKTIDPNTIETKIADITGASASAYAMFYGSDSSKTAAVNEEVDGTESWTFGEGSRNGTTEINVYLHTGGTTSATDSNALRCGVVTYIDTDGTEISTAIRPLGSITLNAADTGYVWQDQNGNRYNGGTAVNLTKSLTLTKVQDKITVTWQGQDATTTEEKEPDSSGSATFTVPAVKDGYIWVKQGTAQKVSGTVTISANTTYTEVPAYLTVTYLDEAGNLLKETVYAYGSSFTVETPPADCVWVSGDGEAYRANDQVGPLLQPLTLQAAGSVWATYRYADGTTESSSAVSPGTTVTLPSLSGANVWLDENGNQYSGGAQVVLTGHMTFTEYVPLTITYNVDFPVRNGTNNFDGVNYDGSTGTFASDYTKPTITYGNQTTETTLSFTVAGVSHRALPVSEETVLIDNLRSGTMYSRYPVRFLGWDTNGDGTADVDADALLSWEQLQTLAGTDNALTFTGIWDHAIVNTVNFFLLYTSAADQMGSTDTADYTESVFTTTMNGSEKAVAMNITPQNDDDAYVIDQTVIRPMYGYGENKTRWMTEFPTDAEVFQFLKDSNKYTGMIQVQNETIDINDLNTEEYVIRWCKTTLYSTGSGWHIDGKIVKKQGKITVEKVFGGESEAITQAKSGFYIVAQNGVLDANGNFVPMDQDANTENDTRYRQVILVLDQSTATSLQSQYPNADFLTYDSVTNDATYTWLLEGVYTNEYWRVAEYPPEVTGYSYYAEYSVYDSDGNRFSTSEFGTQASVVGKTYALDEDPDQGMMVDFKNYYYEIDSIVLKKEDANTGNGIPGTQFEILQDGRMLKFNLEDGVYRQTPDGTTSLITTGDMGFAVITDFSYLYGDSADLSERKGDITVREAVAPAGYDLAPDIVLGLDAAQENVVIKALQGVTTSEDWSDHAEIPNNETLVVKDHTTSKISVTVHKVWDTGRGDGESVQIVLQANNRNAALAIPGLQNVQVELSAANNWTHTWTDLPPYMNGEEVVWGVKEVLVNGEIQTDSGNFENWVVSYSPGVPADVDQDGDTDWSFTVTNTLRRPMLVLKKTDMTGMPIAGVSFSLEEVIYSGGSWQPVSGTATVTEVTGADGSLTFDNLVAGAYYRLTETKLPIGYCQGLEPVIITENGDGLVQKVTVDTGTLVEGELKDTYIRYTNPYNITVCNEAIEPLPNTGGLGTQVYTQSGLLLILLAAALYLYKTKRRREDVPS